MLDSAKPHEANNGNCADQAKAKYAQCYLHGVSLHHNPYLIQLQSEQPNGRSRSLKGGER